MKVQWKLEVGELVSVAFVTDIDNWEVRGCSDEEVELFIKECVQKDFEQKVSFSITKVEE